MSFYECRVVLCRVMSCHVCDAMHVHVYLHLHIHACFSNFTPSHDGNAFVLSLETEVYTNSTAHITPAFVATSKQLSLARTYYVNIATDVLRQMEKTKNMFHIEVMTTKKKDEKESDTET